MPAVDSKVVIFRLSVRKTLFILKFEEYFFGFVSCRQLTKSDILVNMMSTSNTFQKCLFFIVYVPINRFLKTSWMMVKFKSHPNFRLDRKYIWLCRCSFVYIRHAFLVFFASLFCTMLYYLLSYIWWLNHISLFFYLKKNSKRFFFP